MIVVSDTSPLIAFASLGKLTVLKELFGCVIIPQAVHEELSRKGHFPFEDWIDVEKIQNRGLYRVLRVDLGRSQSVTHCLGAEVPRKKRSSYFLMIKRHGRKPLCSNFKKPEQLVSLFGQRSTM